MSVRFAPGLDKLFVPIGSVKQHPDNPRNGDIDVIIESIRVNGYIAPIIVQESTRYIIAGNHRWQALHALKSKVVPALVVNFTDEQALRYLLADNATSDKAMNDTAAMVELMNMMKETDLGLVGTGMDENDLMRMMEELEPEPFSEMPHPVQPAIHGIYEVTVSFDNADDRKGLFEELQSRFGDEAVREANV